MGPLAELQDRFGDRVEFLVVYVREAHPRRRLWPQKANNRRAGVSVFDPGSDQDRARVAGRFRARMGVRMPILVDGIDDRVVAAYGAWPDRLYLIGADGRVAFQGRRGPARLSSDDLGAAIGHYLEVHSVDLP